MNTWHESRRCWSLVKYQLATISRAQESSYDENINHGKWASLKSADHEKLVIRSWLLYIPTGLIELYPHIKYQLATINRSLDSTLDKNLNFYNLAKVLSQWTVKHRSGGHGSCIFLLLSYGYILI